MIAQSNACQTLCRIAEPVEFQAAPVHQAEEQAAHATVGSIEVIERSTAAQLAAGSAEQDHRQLFGVMVAVDHARTVHDGRVVEQSAITFLIFRHPLAEVGELGCEELVDRDEFLRLGVGHLVMLIFGAGVRVSEDRAVVAVFESRDPRRVGAKGEQHDVVHQLPVIRYLSGNAISGPRAIGGGQGRLPAADLVLLTGPLDATFDLVNAAEILLEPLPVRNRESLPQRSGVFEHGINDTLVVAVGLRAEELVEGQRRTRFRPCRRHRCTP